MIPYVFRSGRMCYLAASPALAAAVSAFYRRNREAFAPFDPLKEASFYTEAGQNQLLEGDVEQAEADLRYRFFAVQPRHPGKIVAMVCLDCVVRGAFQSSFISYKVDHTLWGRGYGAETIGAAADWGFRTLGLHRIEANIMPRNLASRRAAEKAGFQEEGLSKQYLKINGRWEDHLHLVRLNEEDMNGRT